MILASIKPYYYYLIAEGKKKIEVRKKVLKNLPQDIAFYMSKDEESFANIPKELQEKYRKHFGKVGMRVVCDKVDKYTFSYYEGEYRVNHLEQKAMCLNHPELIRYGVGKTLSGWHISDLKIYDKPKELSEFYKPCKDKYQYCEGCNYGSIIIPPDEEEYALYHGGQYDRYETVCHNVVTRPPQSWCYIEER